MSVSYVLFHVPVLSVFVVCVFLCVCVLVSLCVVCKLVCVCVCVCVCEFACCVGVSDVLVNVPVCVYILYMFE